MERRDEQRREKENAKTNINERSNNSENKSNREFAAFNQQVTNLSTRTDVIQLTILPSLLLHLSPSSS